MIKTMKRSLVLAVAVAALSAMAVPSMASAANWGTVGSNHTLIATNFGLTMTNAAAACSVSLGAKVRNPASSTLDILSSTNLTCPGPGNPPPSGLLANCTLSGVPSGLPWPVTAVSTTSIQMYMNYTVTISGGSNCVSKSTRTLSGTVSGTWNGNGLNQHSLVFSSASGLTFTAFTNTRLSGTYKAQGNLTLL